MKKGHSRNQRASFRRWLKDRPPMIRVLGLRCPPGRPYTIVATGQLAWVLAYTRDGTIRTVVLRQRDGARVRFEVFGLRPRDLAPRR